MIEAFPVARELVSLRNALSSNEEKLSSKTKKVSSRVIQSLKVTIHFGAPPGASSGALALSLAILNRCFHFAPRSGRHKGLELFLDNGGAIPLGNRADALSNHLHDQGFFFGIYAQFTGQGDEQEVCHKGAVERG